MDKWSNRIFSPKIEEIFEVLFFDEPILSPIFDESESDYNILSICRVRTNFGSINTELFTLPNNLNKYIVLGVTY